MLRYEIILHWSNEDQAFLAVVPELPGCMADGTTYQEALANAEVVMRQWIGTAQGPEGPLPEPKGRPRSPRAERAITRPPRRRAARARGPSPPPRAVCTGRARRAAAML